MAANPNIDEFQRRAGNSGALLDRPDALARERYSISDLTTEFDCTARALRFYEDEGLIAPSRVWTTTGSTRCCLIDFRCGGIVPPLPVNISKRHCVRSPPIVDAPHTGC